MLVPSFSLETRSRKVQREIAQLIQKDEVLCISTGLYRILWVFVQQNYNRKLLIANYVDAIDWHLRCAHCESWLGTRISISSFSTKVAITSQWRIRLWLKINTPESSPASAKRLNSPCGSRSKCSSLRFLCCSSSTNLSSLCCLSGGWVGLKMGYPLVNRHRQGLCMDTIFNPLVNWHNYGKSPFSMGKSTINGNVQ